ncbi:MAG: hypothetical protein V9H26_17760 [Verrucomicrobiota bacterium]
MRNWACYLALDAMFSQVGYAADAATCQTMAAVTAATIVNRWNAYQATLGYLPALLNGSVTAATTPMIEGLAYPAAMGLTNAIDRTGGPYAAMLQALSNHYRGSPGSGPMSGYGYGGLAEHQRQPDYLAKQNLYCPVRRRSRSGDHQQHCEW